MAKDAVTTEFDIDNNVDDDPILPDSVKGGSEKKGGDPASDDDGEDLRSELETLRKRNRELEASERYWASQAQGRDGAGTGKRKPTAPPEDDFEEEEDEPEEDEEEPELDPEKFTDEFTSNPRAALKKAGLLTKKEAKELALKMAEKVATKAVGRAQKQFTQDMALITSYPELGKQDSALFKRTQELMNTDPEFKGMRDKAAALRMAARVASTELKAQGSRKPSVDDDEYESPETERIKRIRAQDGDRGTRRTDPSEQVSGYQGAILRQMGVTPKQFSESKKRMQLR